MTELGFRRFQAVAGETVRVTVTAVGTPYLATFSALSTLHWTIVQPPAAGSEIRAFTVLSSGQGGDSFHLLLDFVRGSDQSAPAGASYRVSIEGDQGSFAHRETIDPVPPFPVDAYYRFQLT